MLWDVGYTPLLLVIPNDGVVGFLRVTKDY
jgi:hypothetical protein